MTTAFERCAQLAPRLFDRSGVWAIRLRCSKKQLAFVQRLYAEPFHAGLC